MNARRRSLNVSRKMRTQSSRSMLSRSASVARTEPGTESWAMMPMYSALGEYQIRTSVLSLAGWLSTGWYSEKPVSLVAFDQAGSSSRPSTTTGSSILGIANVGEPRPSTTVCDAGTGAGAGAGGACRMPRHTRNGIIAMLSGDHRCATRTRAGLLTVRQIRR
jgi:hypothetical protein